MANMTKPNRQMRFDIIGDSPIAGLRESRSAQEAHSSPSTTPSIFPIKTNEESGESLLRGQVKNILLKKDEEDEEFSPKNSEIFPAQKLMFESFSADDRCHFSDEDDDGVGRSFEESFTESIEREYDVEKFENELCDRMRKISMLPKFSGKHTRFVYNSDDEIVES